MRKKSPRFAIFVKKKHSSPSQRPRLMQTFFTILLILLGIGLVAMIVSFVLALIHSDDKEEDKNS